MDTNVDKETKQESELPSTETLTPSENKTSKLVSSDLYKECLTPECDC